MYSMYVGTVCNVCTCMYMYVNVCTCMRAYVCVWLSLYTMCILGLLHVNLYCADTIMCWPIVQVPSANAAGEHWQNRGGERYQGQHAEYGLCNDFPKYFACHVITYKILLLNLFLYNSKQIQVVKMNVNSSLPTIFIDAGIQSWLGLPYCIIIQIKKK